MKDLNNVVLTGRLTKDPEGRMAGDTPVVNFTLACNGYKKDDTNFIPIVVWRNQAEFTTKYLTKGSPIWLTGKIQVRSYTDKEGNKRYVTAVVANDIQALPSGKHGDMYQEALNVGTEISEDDIVPF